MRKTNLGQSLAEYISVTAFAAVAGITVVTLFSTNLQTQFAKLATEITGSSEQSELSSDDFQRLQAFDPADEPDTAQDDTPEEEVDVAVKTCPLPGAFGCGGSGLGGGSLGSGGVRGSAKNPSGNSGDAASAGRTQPHSPTSTARFPKNQSQSSHIFRNAPGHLRDTPANRQLLANIANNPSFRLGTDRFGNVWSATTRADGTQVWVSTRKGVIQNGGVNTTARVFNRNAGLQGQ